MLLSTSSSSDLKFTFRAMLALWSLKVGTTTMKPWLARRSKMGVYIPAVQVQPTAQPMTGNAPPLVAMGASFAWNMAG